MSFLESWAATGRSVAEFWAVTPREFRAVLAGAETAVWRDLRHAQSIAYSQAALTGAATRGGKRLPRFEKVFPDPRQRRAQSGEETHTTMRAWGRAAEVMARSGGAGRNEEE